MNKRGLNLSKIDHAFEFTLKDLKKITSNFHDEMKRGLSGQESSLKMLPAFVNRATGLEKGHYLALDLGGTNFRVLMVELDGKGNVEVKHVGKFVIPNAVMRGTGTQLFNFIAQSIQKFLVKNKIDLTEKGKLGFTFSFPIKQKNIVSGVLINWTKGFTASGVVGVNVVKLLGDALKRYGIYHIKIAALANDTVGTLAAGSYNHTYCDVGIIFGTGTNACYVERTRAIKKLKKTAKTPSQMIVNIEWGNFNKLPLNEYDVRLDKATINPNRQIMEKMISGMYLGELARLVLAEFISRKLIFAESSAKLPKWSFKTRHMSLIEADRTKELSEIESFLEEQGILGTTLHDRQLIKRICRIVSQRAARVSAAAISAVVTWMDPSLQKHHSVAIDGTLYEKYPGFRKSIIKVLRELHGRKSEKIKLFQAKDGSGTGVAIVAAIAHTHQK